MNITVPGKLTLTSFDSVYARLSKLAPTEPLQLDMSSLQFSEPGGLLPLVCVLRNHVRAGGNLVIQSFPDPDACGYLERMNFYDVLGARCPHSPKRRRSGGDRFIEITEIADPKLSERTKDKLHSLVKGKVEIKGAIGASFLTACGELIENTRHAYNVSVDPLAESWPSALVLAQYYEHSNMLHFAVADSGIGIRRSLGAKDPNLYPTERHVIQAALVLGLSGAVSPGKGVGLAAIQRFMARNGGRFSIRTGPCLAVITPSSQKRAYNVSPWKGTVVTLEIRGGREVDISDIIKAMSR